MNTMITGFILTCTILAFAIGGEWKSYLQWHSFLIVVLGSGAIFLFTTPYHIIKNLNKLFLQNLKPEQNFNHVRSELLVLCQKKSLPHASKNPLINYAAELWDQGLNPDLFIGLLAQKKNELISEQLDSVQSLKNLAKYPPALGMTGTVMGMVALFSSLDGNKENIGSNLALAMTATFMGLILSNAIISPIADRLQLRYVHNKRMYTSLYEVILLINQGAPETLIQDEVKHRAA